MKSMEEMTSEEIEKVIKDETPALCYKGIYRPYITERLKNNNSYNEVHKLYSELAKELRNVLKIIDKQPETAVNFGNKADVFIRIMELMRMIADFECAELIDIIRTEEKTGDYLLDRQMKAAQQARTEK